LGRLRKLYHGGKLLDLPHTFEEEVEWLVRINSELLCGTITHMEQEQVAESEKD